MVKKVIINGRAGNCFCCKAKVAARAGFAFLTNGWKVSCASSRCLGSHEGLLDAAKPASAPQSAVGRTLNAAGEISFPSRPTYDELTLVRAMPGARWNPSKVVWTISVAAADRTRVLELADKLKLDVDSSLRTIDDADFNSTMDAAMGRAQDSADQGRPLRDYQYDGVKFLAGRKFALIGDDMGLGKTIQALVALPPKAAAIVVCPASLKWNWHDECRTWRPDLTPVVCKGRKGKSAFRVPAEGELVIINYDILPSYLKPVAKLDDAGKEIRDRKGKVVKEAVVPADVEAALAKVIGIFDECQKAKNYKAQRSQKVTEMCNRLAAVWGATGTPLMNRPLDLWGVLSSLGMNWEVFGSWKSFLRCFGGYRGSFGYEFSGVSGPETAERLRRVMLRRLKADVLKDLPAKQFQTLRINGMSKSIYKELDRLQKIWGETIGAKSLPPFEEFSALRAQIATARIPAVIEYVESFEDAGEPLVVFSAHRAPIDTLGERDGWATITGDTPAAKRRDIVAQFQAGELKGIALTIAAGGEGLTLTRASNLLMVDLDWTPSMNTQAEDRLHRIGQQNAVNIVRMVSDHDLDRHVTDLLVEKSATIAQAVDGVATDVELSSAAERPAQAGVEIVEEDEAAWAARMAEQSVATKKAAALDATELEALRNQPVDVSELLAMDCPF